VHHTRKHVKHDEGSDNRDVEFEEPQNVILSNPEIRPDYRIKAGCDIRQEEISLAVTYS